MIRTLLTGAAGMVTLAVAVVLMAFYAPVSHAQPHPAQAHTAQATHSKR